MNAPLRAALIISHRQHDRAGIPGKDDWQRVVTMCRRNADAEFFARTDLEIAERASASLAKVIATGAERAANQPWRIAYIVYGSSEWPVTDRSTTQVLVDCRRKIEAARQLGRDNHYAFDPNRLIALRQAEGALQRIIAALPKPSHPAAGANQEGKDHE